MPNPGSLANVLPPGDDWLRHKLEDLQRQINELKTAQPNALASRNFDGTFNPRAAGTQGWGLTADGDAVFNSLILREGIIGDDALENPVTPYAGHDDAQNFTITTVDTAVVSLTVPVPDGFTRALVFATMSMSGFNPAATSADFLSCKVRINTTGTGPGWFIGNQAQTGTQIATANSSAASLTGLSGTFDIHGFASTQSHTWPAAAGNAVNLDAIALFLR
jgi:hypothetical protein